MPFFARIVKNSEQSDLIIHVLVDSGQMYTRLPVMNNCLV